MLWSSISKKKWVRVQKLEDVSEDKKNINKVDPMETFLGKVNLAKRLHFPVLLTNQFSMEILFYLK